MLSLYDLLPKSYLSAAAALSLLYILSGAIYRLYFSPVAKFPGPKLAALTFWYEFYYDVVKRGRYTWEIGRMHQKYGPIVRINPYELHIDDPDYYDEIYSGPTKKRDKWEWSAKMLGNPLSVLGTVSHDHHRLRRSALNPYFSKRSVARLEPLIQSLIDSLCARFREARKLGEPVNLGDAFSALTVDIITEYAFSKSYACLSKPEYASEWAALLISVSQATHLNKQFGWLLPVMKAMPEWLVKLTNPLMLSMIYFQKDLDTQIRAILDGENDEYKTSTHPTIFHELLNSDLGPEEKTLQRLSEEGQTVIGAGTITTAHFLKTITFHLLSNPDILHKMKTELASVIPNPGSSVPLRQLEKLPYLSAVVSEGFRVSYGVTSRLPRVSPDSALVFNEWEIPPGTPVSMTSIFMHDNPRLFPNPREFNPERWLKGNSEGRLEKYLVNFSKGTRGCVGINLAHAEIYLTLASVFTQFDLELYQTTREDVDVAHDFFNPSPRLDSKGVRVLVK
ncbi:MAG: hypothetical protein M1839_007908 [Geoglossum umbratile]|nr:MAG: hypothetical protein M1839_007908 [Geoglossum umbratile]